MIPALVGYSTIAQKDLGELPPDAKGLFACRVLHDLITDLHACLKRCANARLAEGDIGNDGHGSPNVTCGRR